MKLTLQEFLNFSRDGYDGRECILRTVCEVAETPLQHNGLVGELLHLFFSPGDHEKVDEDFKEAKKFGQMGVDCMKTYSDCPFGHGILDTVSVLQEFSFKNLF